MHMQKHKKGFGGEKMQRSSYADPHTITFCGDITTLEEEKKYKQMGKKAKNVVQKGVEGRNGRGDGVLCCVVLGIFLFHFIETICDTFFLIF